MPNLQCGNLAHGFLRVRCAECAHEKLVAFSCKRRGQTPARLPSSSDSHSAANLNIHLHCLVLDGVYRRTGGEPVFQEARAPTDEKKLTRLGYLVEEEGMSYLADIDPDNPLTPLQAASCSYRIALGPRAGQKVLSLRTVLGRDRTATAGLCADAHGFSLHAGVRCGTHQRKALERLCRYITRPAIAFDRLKEDAAGNVVLQLKSPWRDGTTHLRMTPLEFMQRLAALVPRPRLHLTRFHGVLAPNAGLRAVVVPGPAQDTSVRSDEHAHGAPARWPELFQAA